MKEQEFDHKFRTGSISEETPDEKRRREFYAEHAGEILSVFNSSLVSMKEEETMYTSRLIDWSACVVSEIAKRAGNPECLRPGDPEFDVRRW